MQNIVIYGIKGDRFLLILFSIFFAGCAHPKTESIYYYSWQTNEDSIPYIFIANKIEESNNVRQETQYEFNKEIGAITDTVIDYYKITDDAIYKLKNKEDKQGDCLLTIKQDTCIEYNHPDKILNIILFSKFCFIGDTILNNTPVYEFLSSTGKGDGVLCRVYYDRSFILVKEDYIKGDCPDFVKKLTNNIPEEFKKLMEE